MNQILELQTNFDFLFAQSIPLAVSNSHLPNYCACFLVVVVLAILCFEGFQFPLGLLLPGLQQFEEREVMLVL